MLCVIFIVGGLLIMMGQLDRSEALFYYFRLEEQVPENHLLRLIDKHISLAFVREKLKESYSDTGRPSVDPELLLRILLIGYLYGITSERKLIEELRMHLAWRWFTGLGFDQEIPHHSTFSKNRHGGYDLAFILGSRSSLQCLHPLPLLPSSHFSTATPGYINDPFFSVLGAPSTRRSPRNRLGCELRTPTSST
jgi:transposase